MQLEQKNKQIEQQKIKLEKTKLEKELLHLCTFRPTKIYIRTLKGADINFVGNSLKDYKPQVRFVIFNGIDLVRQKIGGTKSFWQKEFDFETPKAFCKLDSMPLSITNICQ